MQSTATALPKEDNDNSTHHKEPKTLEKLIRSTKIDPAIKPGYDLQKNIDCNMALLVKSDTELMPEAACYGQPLSREQLIDNYCPSPNAPGQSLQALEKQAALYLQNHSLSGPLSAVHTLKSLQKRGQLSIIEGILQDRSALRQAYSEGDDQAVLNCADAGIHKAQAAGLINEESILMGSKAFVLEKAGHTEESMEAYQRARALYQQTEQLYYQRRLGSNYAIQHHYRQRHLTSARDGLQRGLEAYLATNNHSQIVKSLTKLSLNAYYRNDLVTAISYAEKGIKIAYELERPSLASDPLLALGHARLGLGDIYGARSAYRQTLEVLPTRGPSQQDYWASTLSYLLALEVYVAEHSSDGAIDKAELSTLATKAERIQSALAESGPSGALDLLMTRAQLALLLGKTPEALELSIQASELLNKNSLSLWKLKLDILQAQILWKLGEPASALKAYAEAIDQAKTTSEKEMLWQAHLGKAKVHLSENELKEAIGDLENAASVVENIWVELNQQGSLETGPQKSAYYLEAQISIYDLIIDSLLDIEGQERIAWWWLERRRSNQLRLRLQQQDTVSDPLQPEILLKQVKKSLGPNKSLVEYHVSGSHAVAFVINSEHFQMVRLDIDSTRLHQLLRSTFPFLHSEKDKNASLYVKDLAPLAQYIFWPLSQYLEKATELSIIPDGQLGLLPFEALPIGADALNTPLISKFTTTYRASALDLQSVKKPARNQNPRLLSVALASLPAATGSSEEERLPDLPCARYESQAISSELPNQALTNEQATTARFTQLAKEFDILHIATHGLVSHGDYNKTYLMMWPDEQDDGHLTLSKIAELELKAQLAIIPACRSAVAKIFRGEGIQGVGTAFQSAGVPATIVGLWELPDVIGTSEITIRLVHYLRQGMNTGQALRYAKLDVFRQESDIRVWAPLVLFGANHTIYPRNAVLPPLKGLDNIDMKAGCSEAGLFEQVRNITTRGNWGFEFWDE